MGTMWNKIDFSFFAPRKNAFSPVLCRWRSVEDRTEEPWFIFNTCAGAPVHSMKLFHRHHSFNNFPSSNFDSDKNYSNLNRAHSEDKSRSHPRFPSSRYVSENCIAKHVPTSRSKRATLIKNQWAETNPHKYLMNQKDSYLSVLTSPLCRAPTWEII